MSKLKQYSDPRGYATKTGQEEFDKHEARLKVEEDVAKTGDISQFLTEEDYMNWVEEQGPTTARSRYKAKEKYAPTKAKMDEERQRAALEEGVYEALEAGEITPDQLPARLAAVDRMLIDSGRDAGPYRPMGDPLLQDVAGGIDMDAISGYLSGTVDWTGVHGAQEKAQKSYGELLDANKDLYDTQTRSLTQASDLLARQNKQMDMMHSINRDAAEKVRTSIGSAVDELNTHVLNPYRIYQNGFAAIGSAIAVAIGAYAQGLSPGRIDNTALRILENAEQRDLEAQKAQYQAAKDKIGLANNLYKQMMDQFGNEEDAMAAMQLTTRTYFQNEIKKRELASKDQVTRAAAQLVRDRLEIGNEVTRAKLESNMKADRMRAMATLIRQSKASKGTVGKDRGQTMAVAQMNLDKIGKFIAANPDGINWNDYINMKTRKNFPFLNTVGHSVGIFDKGRSKQFAGLALPLVSTVFMVAKLNDPQAKITDNDFKIFAQSTFTEEDFKNDTAGAKLAEAQRLVNKLSEMTTRGVSFRSEYGSLQGMLAAHPTEFKLLATANSMDSVASTLPGGSGGGMPGGF